MENFDELNSFSWSVVKIKYAIKIIDKSFIEYGETVIPIDIRKYFEIENYAFGDKVDITFLYENKEYNSQIIFENNFNRSKLKLCSQLNKIIANKISHLNCTIEENCLKVIFFKENKHKYLMKVIMEI